MAFEGCLLSQLPLHNQLRTTSSLPDHRAIWTLPQGWGGLLASCRRPLPGFTYPVRSPRSSVDAELSHFLTLVFSFQATFKGWMDIMYAAVDSRGVGWLLPQSQALKAPSCLATGESGSTSESPPYKGQIPCINLQLNLSGMPKPGPGAMVSQGVPQFSNIFQIEIHCSLLES